MHKCPCPQIRGRAWLPSVYATAHKGAATCTCLCVRVHLCAAHFGYCVVPGSGEDAILFAGVALCVTILSSGQLSALYVLVVGAVAESISYYYNLGRFSNSIELWLGMRVSVTRHEACCSGVVYC